MRDAVQSRLVTRERYLLPLFFLGTLLALSGLGYLFFRDSLFRIPPAVPLVRTVSNLERGNYLVQRYSIHSGDRPGGTGSGTAASIQEEVVHSGKCSSLFSTGK